MLKSLVKNALAKTFFGTSRLNTLHELAGQINEAHDAREWRNAIDLLKQLLELDPKNVSAQLKLGIYLLEVGQIQEAYEVFAIAHRLDDSNMEVVVNYARCMMDGGQEDEALQALARAQTVIPGYPYINSIYSSLQFRCGHPDISKKFALRAWLATFENMRTQDGFLWPAAYADEPEEVLTAEHHFWAKTCPPLPENTALSYPIFGPREEGKKLRIGYWSPDFRDHSVRYFFRPLLEGHDREKVELILYHDSPSSDSQTAEIKLHCDQFHSVYQRSDESLVKLIASHDLDILVELAGHTSHNRLWLLQGRLARVQVTGLGYPPTTGLESVDVKLLDPHLRSEGDERFYTERVLELPCSFWCFDPRGDAPDPTEPPLLKSGYVTFGSYGNVSKINPKMIGLWAKIMQRVPRSKLLLRAVNFNSPQAVAFFEEQLVAAGIDRTRFALKGPVPGAEFFRSYGEVDIILDTHPFNGGTTTCFAAYMGVPVVTLKGQSLISRVGASVAINTGAPQLAVDSLDEYVKRAISISQDVRFLKDYRKNARLRMQACSLGNGVLFARDVEEAFAGLIEKASQAAEPRVLPVATLPAAELIKRAAAVLHSGHWAASKRIVDYCLALHPDFAGAHILMTEELTQVGKFDEAAVYLEKRFEDFSAIDKAAVLINIIRFRIFSGEIAAATEKLSMLNQCADQSEEERNQAVLFGSILAPETPEISAEHGRLKTIRRIECVIPCDNIALYETMVVRLTNLAGSWVDISFVRCSEGMRISAYENALQKADADIVMFIQKNIVINSPVFFASVVEALQQADVVGYSGARRWSALDWRLDQFDERAGAYTMPSYEKSGFAEIRIAGQGRHACVSGMAVLEGGLLVANAAKVAGVPFPEDLTDADALLEEYWSYDAGRSGATLAAHRALGVHINNAIELDTSYVAAARTALVKKMNFDVFSLEKTDGSLIVSPVSDEVAGFAAIARYFSK